MPSLVPSDVEIRVMGTLLPAELERLSTALLAARAAGQMEGNWAYKPDGERYHLHHDTVGGYKLVAPVEIGTLSSLVEVSPYGRTSLLLQAYQFLVPCYQIWVRVPPSGGNGDSGRTWKATRMCYESLLKVVDRLNLNPNTVVWTVNLTPESREYLAPGDPNRVVSPAFFDAVLDAEQSHYRAGSWYGASFVGLHHAEGREHYLIVEGDPSRPFRVAQLFYLLVGRTRLHQLSQEIASRVSRSESTFDAERLSERRAAHALNLSQLRIEVNKNLPKRELLSKMSWDLAYDLAHQDLLKDFIDYHSGELLDARGREVPANPLIPTVSSEIHRELRLHYDGPMNETTKWAREWIRRETDDITAWESHLRSHMDLLLQLRIERQQIAIFALTAVSIVLAVMTVLER